MWSSTVPATMYRRFSADSISSIRAVASGPDPRMSTRRDWSHMSRSLPTISLLPDLALTPDTCHLTPARCQLLSATCHLLGFRDSLFREVVLVVGVVVAEERPCVAVEDDAEHLRRIEHVQRFAEQLSRRLVRRHDDEHTVDGVGEQRRVEDGEQRRGVEHNEVVTLPHVRQQSFESWRSQDLMHRAFT